MSSLTPGLGGEGYEAVSTIILSKNVTVDAYLAPRHHPSSLPLIFFAILTSRDRGMS